MATGPGRGDYDGYRRAFAALDASKTVLAGADPDTTNWLASRASHTVYVQRIWWNCVVDNAATITFQDNANTPVKIGIVKGSIGLGHHLVFDAGPVGYPLTEAKGLDIVGSAAGYEGVLTVEGYLKQSSAVTA
jgi:hypothetical protein